MVDPVLEVCADGTIIVDRRDNPSKKPGDDVFLSMWAVYFNSVDHPGRWAVRRSDLLKNNRVAQTGDLSVHDTHAAARAAIPAGLACTARQQADPPQVVEVWL